MSSKRYWYLNGKRTDRDALVRAVRAADAKTQEWRKRANSAASKFERAKSARVIRDAIRAGETAEAKERLYAERTRGLMEALAKGDRRKREAEQPPPKKDARRWRYHVRISYAKRHHNQRMEFYFQRRDGARMTDAEVLDTVQAWVTGKTKVHPEIKFGRVRYGTRNGWKVVGSNAEVGNFIGPALSGDVENIGEEQVG